MIRSHLPWREARSPLFVEYRGVKTSSRSKSVILTGRESAGDPLRAR
jgi:hypothetical protein